MVDKAASDSIGAGRQAGFLRDGFECVSHRLNDTVLPHRQVLRWDPYLEPNEDDMEFRLTYEGPLLSYREDDRQKHRSLHVHEIRRHFHKQLVALWQRHPTLVELMNWYVGRSVGDEREIFRHDGFNWFPTVTKTNGLICKLDVLMLREGQPGRVLYDIDNRLKTVFDALRKADGPNELGAATPSGQQTPGSDEDPFYVLLEDDNLITHVAVTTDTLLEAVPNVPTEQAVRLVIGVTIRPYKVTTDNLEFG